MAAKLGFELVKQAMLKLLMKKGDDGILLTLPKNEIVDYNAKITMDRLIRNGIDPDSLTSPDQVINVLDNINNQIMNKARVIPATSAEGKAITEKLFGKKGEVISFKDKIEAMKKSGDIVDPDNLKVSEKVTEREMFKNSNLNKKDSVTETVSYIKTLEPMDAMKEANSVIGRKGKYKNLTPEESKKILTDTEDHIFERDIPIDPEDMATGGRAGFANGNGVDDELVIVEAYGPEGRKLEKTTRSHAIKYGLTIVDDETKDSGRAGLYTGGIVDVEPSLDDIGHGSDALMARTRLVSPGNQATTSTGLNYLLAEDNDNMRVPFADGKSFSESELLEFNKAIKEKIKKGGRSNMPVIDPEEYKKYLESFKTTEAAEGGRIPFGGGGSYDYGSMQYKIDAVNAAYRRYKKGSQTSGRGGKMTFEQFAPIWAKENFATGGRAGFAKGKIAKEVLDKGRRGFMKTAGAVGAGITALKTGLLGFGKEAAPVVEKTVETVSETAKGVPPYFFKLVDKIKSFGEDVTKKAATKDKEIVTKYKDFELTEDVATGEMTIQRMKVLDDDSGSFYGNPLTEETYMKYKPGKSQADESTKGIPPDEYEEGTALLRNDREYAGDVVDESFKISDDVIEEAMSEAPSIKIKKAGGGIARLGYQMGGDVAYDATDSIYGSSAITVTPDTVMDQFGNQVQSELGNNFNKPLIPQVTEQASKQEGIMNSSPVVSQAEGTGEIDMPVAGGNNNQMGILPVMPQLPGFRDDTNSKLDVPQGGMNFTEKSPDMSDEDIMKGFAEYQKQNPDIMNRPGTMAIVNLTLPGGTPMSFRSGAGAAALRQYLQSIGMEAGPGQGMGEPLKKTVQPGGTLAALASGGIARMLGE